MPARTTVFAYPSNAVRTYAWIPDIDPMPEGSANPTNRGVYADVMGDGSIWSNRLRPEKDGRRWRFNGLSDLSRTQFATFLAAVGGLQFSLCDPITYPAFVTAQLFGLGLGPNWERQRGGLWGCVIELRF